MDAPARPRTSDVVKALPGQVRDVIIGAYNDALTPVCPYMAPLLLISAVLLCFVQEKPLATTIEREIVPEFLAGDGATHEALASTA